jgi:hypothetical protein
MSDIRSMVAEYLAIPVQFGDEWTILCPSPEHVDHRPSASIYVGEPMTRQRGGEAVLRLPGMWVCYSCGRSGRISNEAIENYTPSTDRNLEVLYSDLDTLEVEHRVLPEAWLDLFEWPGGVHPYWLSRFDEATCRLHRLGYDPEREAGTYPFRSPAGELLGVVHRSFDAEATGWKYRYPRGVDKSANLYGYSAARARDVDTVVLVEGALDAVAVDEALRVAGWSAWAALAIYGSRMSEAQAALLRRLYPYRVVFAFDNDPAGENAFDHAFSGALELPGHDYRKVSYPAGIKDVAELDVPGRLTLLDSAQLI